MYNCTVMYVAYWTTICKRMYVVSYKKILKIKTVFSVIKLTLFLLQNQDNKNARSSVGGPRCKIKKGSYLLFPTASDAGGYNLSEGGKVEPLLDCCMTSSASTGVQKLKDLGGTGLLRMRGSAYIWPFVFPSFGGNWSRHAAILALQLWLKVIHLY